MGLTLHSASLNDLGQVLEINLWSLLQLYRVTCLPVLPACALQCSSSQPTPSAPHCPPWFPSFKICPYFAFEKYKSCCVNPG